jgi:hypothetical protein
MKINSKEPKVETINVNGNCIPASSCLLRYISSARGGASRNVLRILTELVLKLKHF